MTMGEFQTNGKCPRHHENNAKLAQVISPLLRFVLRRSINNRGGKNLEQNKMNLAFSSLSCFSKLLASR